MVRLCMAHLWNNVYFTARVSCRGPNCSFPKVRCTCLRDIATGHTPLQCKFLPCLFNCAGQHTIECWGDNFLMSMVQVSFILVSALEANRIEAQITILIQAFWASDHGLFRSRCFSAVPEAHLASAEMVGEKRTGQSRDLGFSLSKPRCVRKMNCLTLWLRVQTQGMDIFVLHTACVCGCVCCEWTMQLSPPPKKRIWKCFKAMTWNMKNLGVRLHFLIHNFSLWKCSAPLESRIFCLWDLEFEFYHAWFFILFSKLWVG